MLMFGIQGVSPNSALTSPLVQDDLRHLRVRDIGQIPPYKVLGYDAMYSVLHNLKLGM